MRHFSFDPNFRHSLTYSLNFQTPEKMSPIYFLIFSTNSSSSLEFSISIVSKLLFSMLLLTFSFCRTRKSHQYPPYCLYQPSFEWSMNALFLFIWREGHEVLRPPAEALSSRR